MCIPVIHQGPRLGLLQLCGDCIPRHQAKALLCDAKQNSREVSVAALTHGGHAGAEVKHLIRQGVPSAAQVAALIRTACHLALQGRSH
jgi:hypothetical protein